MGGACWIRKERRDEFIRYINSQRNTETGTIPAIVTLVLSYIKTHPLLLGAAVFMMSKGKSTPIARDDSRCRLHLDGWTKLNSFQISLIEHLLSNFEPVQRMRREVLAIYEKHLGDISGVQLLCREIDLLGHNAPVRVPLIVRADQRIPSASPISAWLLGKLLDNCSSVKQSRR